MRLVDECEADVAFDIWLDLVAQGETLFVRRHGNVIARIDNYTDAAAAPSPPDTGERAG